jgi:glycosyltransferase involved in cell wall biosynthesis
MKKVSAIICAYNEDSTLKDVILSVSEAIIVNEIIVVNDGSSDNTENIIKELKKEIDLTDIHFKENKGKGYAMAVGVEYATFEIVVFIDADLSNITTSHITQLITPLFANEADMILGQATETLINYNMNPFKSFTGQRALYKDDLLPIIDKMKNSRFGVETLINLYYQSQGKTVNYVMLENLKHPTKFDKTNTQQAMKEFVKEGHQIALTVFKNFDLITSSIKNGAKNILK